MTRRCILAAWMVVFVASTAGLAAKNTVEPPPGPGDPMIHDYLSRLAAEIDGRFLPTLPAAADWGQQREQWKQEYLYMLGLSPLPQRTPLNLMITGTLQRDGYAVDTLWFESRPHLVVTANLYRPTNVPTGTKLPAVLYVCGHGNRGIGGNKAGYQSPPIWFARHGYVCLILDTLDRGEIKGTHRGMFSEGKRWWPSRGYTPAGVECWNGIRGIDYLVSRPDVDANRIAVTGISGGGAATFWIAAADERVKAAVAISGMADLQSYAGANKTDVHCDCMFMPNAFAWPWSRIAALVAPRPLLFVNSDNDQFFPMDANERIISRLERWYGMLGWGDMVDAVVSVGTHAYRQDIRQAACRFINTHLKGDPAVVADTEQDLTEGDRPPIDFKDLCVFPDGKNLPTGAINTVLDEQFVPMASAALPTSGGFETWRNALLADLRRVTFRSLPPRIEAARELADATAGTVRLGSEEGIEFRLRLPVNGPLQPKSIVLVVSLDPAEASPPAWLGELVAADASVYVCEPRGVNETKWNAGSPPNRVERQHVILGRTVETGQVLDIVATARYLAAKTPGAGVTLAGANAAGALALYATLLEPDLVGVIAKDLPASHMDPKAPQFLNVLRVCDISDVIGMLAPRSVTMLKSEPLAAKAKAIYAAANAADRLTVR